MCNLITIIIIVIIATRATRTAAQQSSWQKRRASVVYDIFFFGRFDATVLYPVLADRIFVYLIDFLRFARIIFRILKPR